MIAVAIDGPAGAGKSTISKAAAASLGFIYIDTGALYRAIAYACVSRRISLSETAAVEAVLPELEIRLVFLNGVQHILLNDEDISESIRTEEVSMAASNVSAIPAVREYLLDLQRSLAKNADVIMDGRDIGTVILPNAQVKIFLTASPEKRARRRVDQLAEKGIAADFDKVLYDIVQRDYNDSHRKTAPLKAAEGAVTIDTSDMTLEESIAAVIETIKEKTV